jgi:aryl-alcohol dehydrogenase-like predicted oxidoreductase
MAGNSRLRTLLGNDHRVGLGGEGVLRTTGGQQDALAMLEAAYRNGIRYFDSAPAYAGSEGYLGLFWKEHPERKETAFRTSKSAKRDADGASNDLARTLFRLGRDHLDLWQMQDLRDKDDLLML